MQCEQAEIHLAQLLFDELEPDLKARLEAHLESCPACSERLSDLRVTLGLLGEALQSGPAPTLAPERRAALLAAAAQPRRARPAWFEPLPLKIPFKKMLGNGTATGLLVAKIAAVMALASFIAALFLPALGAARRTSRQMQGTAQLRAIQQGMILYAQGNDGRYPDDPSVLLEGHYVTPQYFVSPMDKQKAVPSDFDNWSAAQKSQWVKDNSSYVFIHPGEKEETNSQKVIGFEKPTGGKPGVSVVFDDNSTQYMMKDQAEKLVEQQTGKSLENWSGLGVGGAAGSGGGKLAATNYASNGNGSLRSAGIVDGHPIIPIATLSESNRDESGIQRLGRQGIRNNQEEQATLGPIVVQRKVTGIDDVQSTAAGGDIRGSVVFGDNDTQFLPQPGSVDKARNAGQKVDMAFQQRRESSAGERTHNQLSAIPPGNEGALQFGAGPAVANGPQPAAPAPQPFALAKKLDPQGGDRHKVEDLLTSTRELVRSRETTGASIAGDRFGDNVNSQAMELGDVDSARKADTRRIAERGQPADVADGAGGEIGGGGVGGTQPGAVMAKLGDSFKATFGGTGGNARKLVYVVDAGGMPDTLPFITAELKRSIAQLSDRQSFTVLVRGDQAQNDEGPVPGLKRATADNKKQAIEWLDRVGKDSNRPGDSNPLTDITRALAYKPDLVFLLSPNANGGGTYTIDPQRLVGDIQKVNTAETRINTIQFLYPDPLAQAGQKGVLETIAEKTGGVYKFLDARALGIPENIPAVPEVSPEAAPVFRAGPVNPWVLTRQDRFSTFALDVDTASFTIARSYINRGQRPPRASVRMEEYVNAFDYNYPRQSRDTFAVFPEAARSPFAEPGRELTLLRIGVQARVFGREGRKPAHLTFVIDTSGSMARPDRLPLVQRAIEMLTDHLSGGDRVSIVTFGPTASLITESTPASDRKAILDAVRAIRCQGSTNLMDGLRLGYTTAERGFVAGEINRVILCSDGVANIGQTNADEIFKTVESYRRNGVTFTSAGFGSGSYNDDLLEKLADHGDGNYVYVDSEEQAKHVFVDQMAATLQTVAQDAKTQVEFNPARVRRYRLIGYENRAIADKDFRNDAVTAGEVGSGQAATALYELELLPGDEHASVGGGASGGGDLGTVFVRSRNIDTGKVEEISRRLESSIIQRRTPSDSPRFFLAAAAARFAEVLRGSEHVSDPSLAPVERVLQEVGHQLPLDSQVRELLRLVQQAEKLPAGQ